MELFLKHRRFPVSFGKIFKNTFFTEHPRTTASENLVTVSTWAAITRFQANKELPKANIKWMSWQYQNLNIFFLKNRIEENYNN